MDRDREYLKIAIDKSIESVNIDGFPVGAILVLDNKKTFSSMSNGRALNDPTNHAETAAIRTACAELRTRDLSQSVLYSSLEPCLMCFAASSWASIPKIVYACGRDKVSKQHFEGNHDPGTLNQSLRHPIKLVHFTELEDQALQVIANWEQQTKK